MAYQRSQQETPKALSAVGRLGVVLLVVVILEIFVLINTAGVWPSSTSGWILLLILGPPIYLLLEYLGGKIFSNRVGYAVSKSRFSVARIGVALLIMLFIFGCVSLVSHLVGSWFNAG